MKRPKKRPTDVLHNKSPKDRWNVRFPLLRIISERRRCMHVVCRTGRHQRPGARGLACTTDGLHFALGVSTGATCCDQLPSIWHGPTEGNIPCIHTRFNQKKLPSERACSNDLYPGLPPKKNTVYRFIVLLVLHIYSEKGNESKTAEVIKVGINRSKDN